MHKNFGEDLAALGCHEAIAFASLGRGIVVKPLNRRSDIVSASPSPAEFAARYGFRNDGFHDGNDPAQAGVDQSLFTAGSLCGHDIPSQHVAEIQALARRADNPFQLENNGSYVVTEQDLLDLEYVKDPTEQKPVWLTIYPRLAGEDSTPLVVPPVDPVRPATPPSAVKPGASGALIAGDVHFAKVWKELRPAILAHHGVVGPEVRGAIHDAFLPLLTAAAQVGLLGEDGSIQGGVDE